MNSKSFSFTQIKEWNDRGFIPGLNETEAQFIERINFCLNLQEELAIESKEFPFHELASDSTSLLKDAITLTDQLYGIKPDWVLIFCDNYRLLPWHGGCAWIFQLKEASPTAAFLQLRNHFLMHSTYLRLYRRNELIAHELAHVARMMYNEPQFEEILAYQSSSQVWRRWLGPIIQSSKESLLFLFSLFIVVLHDFTSFFYSKPFFSLFWIRAIPFCLILYALGRLIYRQRIFQRCFVHLKMVYKDTAVARHLLYRLTDREIKLFSKMTTSQIKNFIYSSAELSFRWQFLINIYPV